jgi:amino acid transporter
LNFTEVVDYAYVMFFYVLPSLLILLVILWLKDWVVKIVRRWHRSALAKYEEIKEDRWMVILEVMKIGMFLAMLFPMVHLINYATNERVRDPGTALFNETMPYVFLIITIWYLLAIVIYGVYLKNKQDIERDKRWEEARRKKLEGELP